jgi:hypothetical protein
MSESKGVVAAKTIHLAAGGSWLAKQLSTHAEFTLLRNQVVRRHPAELACEPKSEIFASTWIAVTVRGDAVTCARCREYAPFV